MIGATVWELWFPQRFGPRAGLIAFAGLVVHHIRDVNSYPCAVKSSGAEVYDATCQNADYYGAVDEGNGTRRPAVTDGWGRGLASACFLSG